MREEIKKLQELLHEEKAKIEGLNQEIERLREFENKIYQMENKTAMLSSEIERRKVKEATKEKQFAEMVEKLELLTS